MAPLRLVFAFDSLTAPADPAGVFDDAEVVDDDGGRLLNGPPTLATPPHFAHYLHECRERLGVEVHLVPTAAAAAQPGIWLYELAAHNNRLDDHLEPGQGFWPRLPEAVRAALVSGRARLLLTNLIEGDSVRVIEALYRYLATTPLPPAHVCYVCASANLAEIHDALAPKEPAPRVHVAGCAHFELRMLRHFESRGWICHGLAGDAIDHAFAVDSWEAAFLSLNGKARSHRLALLGLLARRGLLDRGLVSLNAIDSPEREWWPRGELGAEARLGVEGVAARLPLVLDPHHDADHSDCFSAHLFARAPLSIVGETFYVLDPGQFPTEKTYRPILHLHPLVMLATPGTLAALRRSGYATFAPHIDESYDEIADPDERLDAVAAEIARLCTIADRGRWHRSLAEVVEHNLAWLLALRTRPASELDRRLRRTLAELIGAEVTEPAPAAVRRFARADIPAPRPPRDLAAWVAQTARRLWRLPVRAWVDLGLLPLRLTSDDDKIVIELGHGDAVLRVFASRPAPRPGAVHTGRLTLWGAGPWPAGLQLAMLQRLAKTLGTLDYEGLRRLIGS